jgi:hypothetical protein
MNKYALFKSVVGKWSGMSQGKFADARQDRKLSVKYVKESK